MAKKGSGCSTFLLGFLLGVLVLGALGWIYRQTLLDTLITNDPSLLGPAMQVQAEIGLVNSAAMGRISTQMSDFILPEGRSEKMNIFGGLGLYTLHGQHDLDFANVEEIDDFVDQLRSTFMRTEGEFLAWQENTGYRNTSEAGKGPWVQLTGKYERAGSLGAMVLHISFSPPHADLTLVEVPGMAGP